MIQVTTTSTYFSQPKAYRHAGECRQCGAPLYEDRDLPKDEHGNPTQLPQIFYTCSCRYNLQPAINIPSVFPNYPAPDVVPVSPTWAPNSLDPRWGTAKPIDNGFDWSRYTQTGGITAPPNSGIICLNGAFAGHRFLLTETPVISSN